MATHTARIDIGSFTSSLRIRDERGVGPSLNLIWGFGGGSTPEARADQLLDQNGYQRVGNWVDGTAEIVTRSETTQCSCWLDSDGRIERRDLYCRDHATERV